MKTERWYLWYNHLSGRYLFANYKVPQYSCFKIVKICKTRNELFI